MKTLTSLLFLFVLFSWSCKQQTSSSDEKSIAGLFPNMGHLHHPVSTKNNAAQEFFNQGFTLIYGFNHEEAVRSFEQALKYDSTLAMAYWGIAFCYGSNYNWPADLHATRLANENIKKAESLLDHASDKEKDYINTLAVRYTDDSTADFHALEVQYSQGMKALSEKYPDDLDARCLYAESMMNLHPWELWLADGSPNENTNDIIAALEYVLSKDSMHIGANHYYIHATEASPHPEKALSCARRLASLVPNAGHLVHMPAHVYMRTGNYTGANEANAIAADVDSTYIKQNNIQGIYPMIYYTHNLHFLAIGCLFAGKNDEAKSKIAECLKQVDPMMAVQVPMMQFITATPFQIYVGAEDWSGIMNYPKPDSMLNITTAMWHWARAIALIEKGDIKTAQSEQKAYNDIVKTIPADQPYSLGTAKSIDDVASNVLSAKMSETKKDMKAAEEYYTNAVASEKKLHYDEPPQWMVPTANMLGGFYLRNGKYAEAEAAFRESLQMYPNNGRALFGLSEALKAQNKNDEASKAKAEFDVAWKNADKSMTVTDL
jgi:tetratricopeptide (TPR) repeat protein